MTLALLNNRRRFADVVDPKIIGSSFEVGAAITHSFEVIRNSQMSSSEKAGVVATELLFVATQGADFYCTVYKPGDVETRVIVKVAAGGARIVKRVVNAAETGQTSKLDIVDLAAVVVNSLADLTLETVEIIPRFFGDSLCKAIKREGPLVGAVASFCSVAIKVCKIWNGSREALAQRKLEQEVLNATSIEGLSAIPFGLGADVILSTFICGISGKPIRYILVVLETAESDNPVYYERSTFNEWCEVCSYEPPPHWPEGVRFVEEGVVEDKRAQQLINNQLRQRFPEEQRKARASIQQHVLQ